MNETGIVTLGSPGAPVHVGNFTDPTVLLAIFGFILMCFFMIKKIKGGLLLGILSVTLLSFVLKLSPIPAKWVSMPPSISPIFLQLDILGALNWGFFSVILTVFVMDFVDTMGTLIGLSFKSGLLDENGELPEIEKPMLCDAIATVAGALLGTTTTGTYIESATGIEAGGKSGLTAVVTAFLFLTALFFAPLFQAIPSFAYGPALIMVGMIMLSPIAKLDFDDLTELIPAFTALVLMSFTYNLGIGMTASFVMYPLVKILSGRTKDVSQGMWILGGLSLVFYVFFPY